MNAHTEPEGGRIAKSFKWVLCGLLVVAAFFLFTEHRAHLFGILPYLLLLSCPLMHVFMHHGHGGHRHHDSREQGPPSKRDSVSTAAPQGVNGNSVRHRGL
jgi:hypothetical protein